jgi:hypothetical protein
MFKYACSSIVILVTLLLLLNTSLSAQIKPAKFGKGFNIDGVDSTFALRIGFRFQTLIVADWSLSDEAQGFTSANDVNAFIRRSRLKFDGWAHTPRLKYKLELALSNRDNGGGANLSEFGNAANIILDAHLTYNFYKNFSVRLGQGKLASNRERVISSGNLQFVDRSRLNSRYNIDRDVFLQISHHHTFGENFIVKESASIASGEGKNHLTGFNGGFGYTYRLEFLPFGKFQSKGDYVSSAIKRESKPKLALGFTYDNNNNAGRERGQNGSFIINSEGDIVGNDLNTFFADLMFKYQGLSVMIEYADKSAPLGPLVFDEDNTVIGEYFTGTGLNLNGGYMFRNNVEVALRYTTIDAEIATDEKQYTIGLNKFFVGHKLKIQTDFTLINRDERQNSAQWRTQVDIHF